MKHDAMVRAAYTSDCASLVDNNSEDNVQTLIGQLIELGLRERCDRSSRISGLSGTDWGLRSDGKRQGWERQEEERGIKRKLKRKAFDALFHHLLEHRNGDR